MKRGVYGGSFNPPHLGHLRLVKTVSDFLGLDRVMIVPSNISPQKSDNGNIDPTHRINMCRMTFSEPLFEISDTEIKRGGKSYTRDTLAELHETFPEDDFYLIMGSDMLLSFTTWYKPREILQLCEICAFSREGGVTAEDMRAYAEKYLKEGKVSVLDVPPLEISSTDIRLRLKNGGDCSQFLEENTLKYIKEKGLYEE